jgi:peptidoglycan hydrolase-like protein with peptidoglycan-binding domain
MVTVASRFLRYTPEEMMRGPDVREVQSRLRALGLYQGALDGVYGRGTYDAVVAFQARRQLTPDGVVGPATYNALGQGPTPQALGDRGPVITIDVENRRLFLTRQNRMQRAWDVAVGAPVTPTPVGRWVLVEKQMNPGGPFGDRWMRINVPWGGYGVHGTDEEESIGKAVSHGCVRMHNADVRQLYDLIPVGTIVNIVGQIFTGRVLIPGQASGPDVRAVQEILQALGFYRGDIDGIYGPGTADAVRRFQAAHGLTPDGIVGPNTYDKLMEAFDSERGNTSP